MEKTASKGKLTRKLRKLVSVLGIILFCVFLIGTIAHNMWKSSGSNEWELASDDDGIKIWTRKVPGNTLLQLKASMNVKSTLSSVVYYISDEATGSDVGSYDMQVLEKRDSPEGFWAYYSYKVKLPEPIGTMDAVILLYYTQDTITKEVEVNVLAAPNKIPRIPEYWRLSHMHDIWNVKPLPNGEVECQIKMDLNPGIPYFLFNSAIKKDLRNNFDKMRDLVKTEKYLNGSRPYLKEYDE